MATLSGRRMDDDHIPKDLLYGELASGSQGTGCPQLCYKDTFKWNMKACDIIVENRTLWKQQVSPGRKRGVSAMHDATKDNRARRGKVVIKTKKLLLQISDMRHPPPK